MAKTSVASLLINTTIISLAGRRRLSELPDIADYSPEQIERAKAWPAVERYLQILSRQTAVTNDALGELRIKRHREWLKCALATFHETKSAQEVCLYWSQAASRLIHEAWQSSGCEASGYALLALGKLGAEELNLSSDVDLIMVRADNSAPELRPFREFQNLLSETTELGFCLRTDFTLRPGGRSSSPIPNTNEFEYHYGYHGEMWERLAYVRMRILEGPANVSQEIRTFSKKFSYRKHLDYTLLDELKSLRSKIRAEKFESRPGFYHLKLGEGGIRELELFVHALQVMHGGRNPLLQTYSTTSAIEKIRELKLLPAEECDFLIKAYWYLRTLENRLQAYEDQQNYSIDTLKGHPALPNNFVPELQKTTARITAIATSLFGEERAKNTLPDSEVAQQEWLFEKGFSRSSCEDTWPQLLAATALSRRSDADEQARLAFLQGFVEKLSELKLDRDLGLSLLLDFVRAVRAKASFFTLLNRETRVRDELAMLFSISPYLGSILSSRPELIDEFIFRKLPEPSADFNTLLEELAERRLVSELIAANHFWGDRDLRNMTITLSSNADGICALLLERLKADLHSTDLGLIALGKWGGRELGLRSDLDFIFVTPASPTQEDHKVAKRFLSRITEPHRGGSIYAVDMRLRPSGQSGPIMVTKLELERYLRESAAAWERQAYLRARGLTDLSFHPAQVATSRGLSPADLNELRMIRAKLFVATSLAGDIDLKLTLGGLADVEFTAQIALLARREFSLDPSTCGMIQYLESIDANWKAVGPQVREQYEYLRRIEQLFQLTTSQSGSKLRVKSDEFRRLSLILDSSPADLEAHLKDSFAKISTALKDVRDLDA